MAQASRKIRSIRRLKNKVRLQRRQARRAVDYIAGQANRMQQELQFARFTLLAVLAQNGNVTVTKGTIEQLSDALARMDFSVTPAEGTPEGQPASEFLVKLVEREAVKPESPAKPALTITKIEDEDEEESFPGSGENDASAAVLSAEVPVGQ